MNDSLPVVNLPVPEARESHETIHVLTNRDPAAARAGSRILAFDELHHEGRESGSLLEDVGRGDIRMVRRGDHFRFALKPRESRNLAALR